MPTFSQTARQRWYTPHPVSKSEDWSPKVVTPAGHALGAQPERAAPSKIFDEDYRISGGHIVKV